MRAPVLGAEDAGDALDSAADLLSELRGIVGQSMKMGLRELAGSAEREAAQRRMAEYEADIEALAKDLARVVRERRTHAACRFARTLSAAALAGG